MKELKQDLDKLDIKIDVLTDKINDIRVILGQHNVTMIEHIKRDEALEERFIPVEKHVHMVNGAMKLVAISGIIIGALTGFLKLVGLFP